MISRKFNLYASEIEYHPQRFSRGPAAAERTTPDDTSFPETLEVKKSYRLYQTRSLGAEPVLLELTDEDRIELLFDDETVWFGDTAMLDEVFPDLNLKTRAASEVADFPVQLNTNNTRRSVTGAIVVKVLTIFAKKALKKIVEKAGEHAIVKLAAEYEKRSLGKPGLFRYDNEMKCHDLVYDNTSDDYFLMIHGTASSTTGSFDGLLHSDTWRQIQSEFKSNVLGLQHETLTKSPLYNVLQLVKQLPAQARLTVMTHSRGGIVGEILAKFAHNKSGFTQSQIEYLKKNGHDTALISEISKEISKKEIKIEKYIRVACPAYGTSLMSKRIDIICNVLMNLIPLEAIRNFCRAVIDVALESRTDVAVLPGLETMRPDSALLNVLNTHLEYDLKLDSPLAIVAGNSTLSLSWKALVVMLSRYIFEEDNDFVVNTLSMYQGVQRKVTPVYFLDEGGEVNHVSYFKNRKTQTAILSVLKTNQFESIARSLKQKRGAGVHELKLSYQVPAFSEYKPETEWDAQRGLIGLEYGRLMYDKVSGKKPILILLPGIMGSHLDNSERSIWLNYIRLMAGDLDRISDVHDHKIKANAVIRTAYKKLADFLSARYDVYTFAFDWRKPVTDSGNELNTLVKNFLNFDQPIQLLAHSMGGLVARELMINHSDTWKKVEVLSKCALLMLGTPWLGSYRIAAVLSGNDGIINQVSKLDLKHQKHELINMFSKFPGLLNLLPIHENAHDFSQAEIWNKFQLASGLQWQIPDAALLESFKKFREDVVSKSHNLTFRNVVYVAGKDNLTPSDYTIINDELHIHTTEFGDQSVTWDTGIPKGINHETSVYYVDETHGGLSCSPSLFEGILELLKTGNTIKFDRSPARILSAKRGMINAREDDIFEITEDSVARAIMGIKTKKRVMKIHTPALSISITKGHLKYSRYPILIGHFFKDGIISAEKVADHLLGFSLSKKHSLGIYPGQIGSSEIEIPKKSQFNDFNGAIIVGLGLQESLTINSLSTTIEKATLCYLMDVNNGTVTVEGRVGISSLLIGSFYGGLPLLSSVRAIVQGINQANAKVNKVYNNNARLVEHIEIIELYEDRALQCFRTIQSLMSKDKKDLQLEWETKEICQVKGSRKRILSENITDWWHRISILVPNQQQNDIRKMTYYSSTATSREEMQDLYTNIDLIESCLYEISDDDNWNVEKAKTLFELLIPNDFKQYLHSQHNIVWVLDNVSASYPWELLQTSLDANGPICTNAKMIRQLATYDYDKNISNSKSSRILIVGDPDLEKLSSAPQLPGARQEATEVYNKFKSSDIFDTIELQIHAKSTDIITALFKTDYRVMHLAGHGVFDKNDPLNSGMLIGRKNAQELPLLLTPNEIAKLEEVPEFVFLNCCYLGSINADSEKNSRDKYKLAGNLGTELINKGVKAVVIAGWAVDDASALLFAETFYDNLLDGASFGDAVFDARKKVYEEFPATNTWGAYQCYGDPFYKLVDKWWGKNSGSEAEDVFDSEIELEYELDNLLQDMEISDPAVNYAQRLWALLEKKERSRLDLKNVAVILEKTARAYLELNNYKDAIECYEKLVVLQHARYQISALEQYYNVLCKFAFAKPKKNIQDIAESLKEINTGIQKMNLLIGITDTAERLAIRGSAYKRKAAILAQGLKADIIVKEYTQEEVHLAINHALTDYKKAFELSANTESIYAYCNWKELEAIMVMFEYFKRGETYSILTHETNYFVEDQDVVLKVLDAALAAGKPRQEEFWDRVAYANALLCKRFISDTVSSREISEAYINCWNYNGSLNKKVAELEHFDILIYLCTYFEHSHTQTMLGILQKIKNDLQDYLAGHLPAEDTGDAEIKTRAAKKRSKAKRLK